MKLKHDWTFVCEICERVIEKDEDPYDGDYNTECCGESMQRIYPNHKQFHIIGAAYMRTKYSDSLAVSMSQIAEHREKFPGIEIDSQGRPGFDNVKQQDAYLETSGMVKHSQKIRKIKQLT